MPRVKQVSEGSEHRLSKLWKAPFPWFGGKTDAAPHVWRALGYPAHYVEPFMGSLATLLLRPHTCNRPYYSETVNDLDGLLVNAWRGIQLSPKATADAASWPVSEADLHARHLGILAWKQGRQLEHLMGDPAFHDPVIAGWWLWGQCCWIGSGWCSGTGPWVADARGFITKNTSSDGVRRQLPHLGNNGQGVNRPQARELGVSRQLPHLGGDGQGVNHASCREPVVGEFQFHPMTMPELLRWFEFLSARLRHVRILNGDWKRAVTGGATKTLSVRMGDQMAGVFLDPPYGTAANRASDLYAEDSLEVATEVRKWCAANGNDPKLRIVLAGFDGEHESLAELGWRPVHWFKAGFLKGGMGNQSEGGHQQKSEVLWLSPTCCDEPVRPKSSKLSAKQLAIISKLEGMRK